MKRKLAFLTALIMGMSAVSVTTVVDSDYITASAETTTPELPELKKGEARVIFTDYDTGEIIQFENADDEKRIVSMYADIRYRNMDDTGGDWVSTGPIYIIKSNPYYCDIAKFLDADFFDVSLPTNNLPEGYSLPDDYKVITKNDNGSLEIEFRLKKAPEIIKEGRLVGCDTSDIFFTLDSEGTLTLSGKGETPCHLDIAYDKRVKKLVIKEGITGISLESLIFPNLESVVFPESLDYIGYCGIGGKFKEITIPDSMVGGIDPRGFYEDFTVVGYENTYAKVFADSVGCSFKSLGEAERRIVRTGALCENVNYDIYNTLELVISGSGVIKDCDWYSRSDKSIAGSAVKKLTIEEGITSISDCVAPGCSNLTEVILPDSLTSIDGAAFYECTGLTEITIPKNVTSIGDYTFLECKRLKTIKGYKGTYAETYAKENGYEFVALEEEPVTIVKTGKVDGCSESNLTYTLDSEGTLTISGKGDMPCHAGFFDDSIKKIVIEEGVTGIGMEDFFCENLETIILQENACCIDSYAFSGSTKLKEIYISDTQTGGISTTAFGNRDSSFTVIGYDDTYAQLYAEMAGFTFKSLGKPERKILFSDSLGGDVKYDLYNTLEAVISGKGKMNDYDYMTTPFANSAVKSVTVDEGVTNIPDGFFTKCSILTQITLPDSLTSIGSAAFYECTALNEITIPQNVTSIGKEVFRGAENFKTIKGYKGTYAETYAKENGYEFISLGNVPVTTTTTSEQNVSLIGDANCDGDVNMADAVLIMQTLANPDKYGITGADATHITEQGMKNADVNGEGVTNSDALEIQKYMLKLIEDFE